MRDIKFRAWDKENEEMINVARFDIVDYTVYRHLFACDGYLAEDLEIMQYTGLLDKNGCEIYEGDIMTSQSENVKVVFSEGCFLVMSDTHYENLFEFTDEEVIGNIYNNPDLI